MWRRVIDALGNPIGIESQLDGNTQLLDAVFKTYREHPGPIALDYQIRLADDTPTLFRGSEQICQLEEPIALVAPLERDFYHQLTVHTPGLLLHAGCVVGRGAQAQDGDRDRDREMIVVSGESGAGKSTLVRAMLARGFRYATEEIVALGPGGRCEGLSRPLNVDDDAIEVPAGFGCADYLIRLADGLRRCGRLFHPPAEVVHYGPGRARAVVVISHADDADGSCRRLTAGEAMVELWPQVFRRDDASIGDAAAALEGVPCYRLHTQTAAEALAKVLALAREVGVAPF